MPARSTPGHLPGSLPSTAPHQSPSATSPCQPKRDRWPSPTGRPATDFLGPGGRTRSSLSRIWTRKCDKNRSLRNWKKATRNATKANWSQRGYDQLKKHRSWRHRGGKGRREQSSLVVVGGEADGGGRARGGGGGVRGWGGWVPGTTAARNHPPVPGSWSSALPARIPGFLHDLIAHSMCSTDNTRSQAGVGLCSLWPNAKPAPRTCKQEASLSDKP